MMPVEGGYGSGSVFGGLVVVDLTATGWGEAVGSGSCQPLKGLGWHLMTRGQSIRVKVAFDRFASVVQDCCHACWSRGR